MPRTTVIVVSYNHAAFVRDCLDSIREQSRPAARVLIADDASPDGRTQGVISEYVSAHAGFADFYPNPENIGLNATLNRMLALVDTEYVTYISADDVMLPERISTHEDLLDCAGRGTDLAYSDALVIDETGRRVSLSSEEFTWPEEYERTHSTAACLVRANWVPAASIFLRTSALRAAGGYREGLFFEDFELLTRMAARTRFVATEQPLVAVRRLSTSLGTVGFEGSSPRFIRAMYVSLRNTVGLSSQTDALALPRMWHLAVRAQKAGLPWRETLPMTWASRRGAPTVKSRIYRLARALVPH